MAPLCAQLWLPETKGVGDSGIKSAVSVPAASRNPSKKKKKEKKSNCLDAERATIELLSYERLFFFLTLIKRANKRRHTDRPSLFIFKVEHFNSPSSGAVCGWPGAAVCGPRLGTKRKNMGGRHPYGFTRLFRLYSDNRRARCAPAVPPSDQTPKSPFSGRHRGLRQEGATPVVVSAAATPLRRLRAVGGDAAGDWKHPHDSNPNRLSRFYRRTD